MTRGKQGRCCWDLKLFEGQIMKGTVAGRVLVGNRLNSNSNRMMREEFHEALITKEGKSIGKPQEVVT